MPQPKPTPYLTDFPGLETKFGRINVNRIYLVEHRSGRKEIWNTDGADGNDPVAKVHMLHYIIEWPGITNLTDVTDYKLAKKLYE